MDEERGGEDPLFQTDNFRIYEYKAGPRSVPSFMV